MDHHVTALVAELEQAGVSLWEESGQLRYRAPKGVMTPERLDALRAAKAEVLAHLRAEQILAMIVPDPGARYEAFPLTDVQTAYLLGRGEVFEYGQVACHVYLEVTYPDLDPRRLTEAWNRLVERHDMLRVVIESEGYQRVLPTVPPLRVPVADLREADDAQVAAALEATRSELGHQVRETDRWPLFELRATRTARQAVLHLSMDFLVSDWTGIRLLLTELERLHADPAAELPPLELQFRDYLLAERRLREGARYQRDHDYWWSRLDELPPAPELPVLDGRTDDGRTDDRRPRFRRRFLKLDSPTWEQLKQRAQQRGLTPSAAVLAAYATVVERWSRTPRFCLNLTVLGRLPLHPQVGQLVGDFTSVNLLEVDWSPGVSFAARAKALGGQLFEDLDHRLCSGVEVIRELARRRGREAALMPIVFTSAIGLDPGSAESAGRLDGFGITQTPQVFIDCQAMDDASGLQVNWDVREGVFPGGVVDDMFDAFERLVRALADGEAAWEAEAPVPLPEWQAAERRRVNDTAAPLPDAPLHHAVLAQADRTPQRPAVLGPRGTLTYGELACQAAAVAEALRAGGCAVGDQVAIVMDKGAEQVVAVLGSLLAGAVYLPLDTTQPPLRRAAILADAGVRQVLTQSWVAADWPADHHVIAVDRLTPTAPADPATAADGDPDAPAYVIYTSGSTGRPKGVVVSHRAAGNTIADINRRFAVTAEDRVLGLAGLGFDLSVYDVFGPLSVGAALVLPDGERRTDPSHWAALIAEHGVTLWDSVPALMQMLAGYLDSEPGLALPSLRLALLSGDWIPVTLPDEITARLPGLSVVALGGATEASIWSIAHRYQGLEAGWRSIPYGRPLANQGFRVLDAALRDCPVWAVGELYISGAGLALGYLGDPQTTAHRFVTVDGHRLYRTSDFGRYLPGGEIEFLGREDTQVKVRGHRIELGEIEAALLEHPAVAAAGAVLEGTGTDRSLLAVVETARADGAAGSPQDALDLGPLASAAADWDVPGLDRLQIEYHLALLDDAVLTSMAHALAELGGPEGEIPSQVEPRHHWLVRRWLAQLAQARKPAARQSTDPTEPLPADPLGADPLPADPVDADTVARRWQAAEAAWSEELGSAEFLAYLRRNAELLPQLLTGRQDPVALLFPEGRFDTAHALYREHAMARYLNRAVSTLLGQIAAAHGVAASTADRPLRVLEAGAGTGGTTAGVLAALANRDVDYLFTDVSPFFLPEARNRFGEHPGIRFGVFDVDGDHRAQGLVPNSFDVVLAAGVLENARDIPAALDRLTELLAPGGWLVITEPTREHPWILASQAFMMTAPEDGERDGGPSYLDRDQWLGLLARSGAEQVLCLPGDDHPLAPQGVHLFAARLKTDRVPVTAAELLRHLADRLPAHMVPSHLQLVDALPLTANGKVDRARLRGWRPAGQADGQRAATGEAPADALEARLAELWEQALAVGRIGRAQSLYELGADSLIMARMAGRLREELPEAAGLPFDTVLRQLLNEPNIAALARFLRERAGHLAESSGSSTSSESSESSQNSGLVGRRSTEGNAVLVPFSAGGTAGQGPLRVMFHAGLGTMDCYRPLAKELVAQRLGPVLGIVIDDTERYTALDPATVIERAADDYAARLLAEGHHEVQLIGYCLGGLYATEVARRLDEAGVRVTDLVLVSSHPVLIDVEDDLMLEVLFVPNLHIPLGQAGFGEVDADAVVGAIMHVVEQSGGRVPLGALTQVAGTAGLDAAADFFRRLAAQPQPERFARYAAAASQAAGQEMPAEMVAGMFKVYRQSFLSARFAPPPYAGDIRFLLPRAASGFAPGMDDSTLGFWREVCIGEFDVTGVDGNHFSCIEQPNVRQVAELVAAPLRAARKC